MSFFSQYLKTGSLTTDLVVLGVLCLLFFFYALYFGRARIISLILAFYPAVFFYKNFPFLNKFLVMKGDTMILLNKVLIFLVFLILLNIAIGRYIFSDSGYGSGHVLRNIGFALSAVVLLLVFSYTIISLDSLYTFSPTVSVLFSSPDKIFWWTLVPMGVMFVM